MQLWNELIFQSMWLSCKANSFASWFNYWRMNEAWNSWLLIYFNHRYWIVRVSCCCWIYIPVIRRYNEEYFARKNYAFAYLKVLLMGLLWCLYIFCAVQQAVKIQVFLDEFEVFVLVTSCSVERFGRSVWNFD